MKAWRIEEPRGIAALELAELPLPQPGADEVVIEVHAAALNFSDLLMAAGRYQVRPPLPFVPGQEIAGRVAAAGPGSTRRVGDRVATKVEWGGFAQYARARDDMLIPLPDAMPFDAGATLPVVWPTAWIALFQRARIAPGETVLVHAAAGGVGLAAVQLAHATRARVIAGVGDEAKAELARAAGADAVVVTRGSEWAAHVAELTGRRGPDIVFDPVGGDLAEPSLKLLARNGRYLVVGFAGGAIPQLPAHRLLLRNASALGVYWSHDEDGPLVALAVDKVLELWRDGTVRIEASRSYAFAALPAALDDLAARRTTGKCVLAVKEET